MDPLLGETMMQLVPALSPVNNQTINHIDFDLDLLDCQVPSPCPPSPDYLLSPTMFSPDSSDHWSALSPKAQAHSPRKDCAPSPCPSSSSSSCTPYSPAARHRRCSSNYVEQRSVQDSWHEFQQLQDRIKQEQELLLDGMVNPAVITPAATTAAIPLATVKREPFDTLLKTEPGQELMMTATHCEGSNQLPDQHPVLKQFLSDTSFQSKYNLKPFNFGGVAEGFVIDGGGSKEAAVACKLETVGGLQAELEDVKPVLDLAVQQVRKDIETTCEILSIPKDPRTWSSASVKSWVLWTLQQFSIPLSTVDMSAWNLSGQQMVNLSETEFVEKIPQGGETLYAQYDLWKSNWADLNSGLFMDTYPPPPYPDYLQYTDTPLQAVKGEFDSMPVSPPYSSVMYSGNPSTFTSVQYTSPSSFTTPPTPSSYTSAPSFTSPLPPASFTNFASPPAYPSDQSTDMCVDDEEDTDEDIVEKGSPTTGRTSTNIHLWQFVKELLLQPALFGNYINWVDRDAGVFKIVDSVKVATLWGKRKNRPAMNYDKLSRSLRQYYKKGIMKKTERSQRLVYQFCHPYHM